MVLCIMDPYTVNLKVLSHGPVYHGPIYSELKKVLSHGPVYHGPIYSELKGAITWSCVPWTHIQ